jgi:hypothetical protein
LLAFTLMFSNSCLPPFKWPLQTFECSEL